MAPVVHGLEKEYAGQIDFLYLNVAKSDTKDAQVAYGFQATPHFFFLTNDGTAIHDIQGVVPADSIRRLLERLLITTSASAPSR